LLKLLEPQIGLIDPGKTANAEVIVLKQAVSLSVAAQGDPRRWSPDPVQASSPSRCRSAAMWQ
jgi:hypothetical protein